MLRVISTLLVLIPSALCCGGNYVLEKGAEVTIQTPDYPNPFPQVTCEWKILATEGVGFKIACHELDLVPKWNCKATKIQINSESFQMKICRSSRFDIRFEGSSFQFNFKSSMQYNFFYGGFSCAVSLLETLSDQSTQQISSPVTVPDTQPTLPPHRCNCGLRKIMRIVGGQEASLHEYPWQVLLNYKDKKICGGTLISQRFVLTAAHCLEGQTINTLTVSLGEHDRSTPDETHNTMHLKIASIIVHESFSDGVYYNNDIALLELSKPVTFTAAISPACLPFGVEEATLWGEMGIVTGWGFNKTYGSLRPILREVELPMMSTKECKEYYEDLFTENMFCTYTTGKDACKGDSGGPLVWSKDGSQYYIVGIVSWGDGCAKYGKPGVYTKVTNYLRWIERKTKDYFCRELK